MDYSITSDKINPYVRFAGYSDEYTSSGNKPVYAEDCRLFYFLKDGWMISVEGVEYKIGANTLVLLPPNHAYQIKNSTDTGLYSVNFDYLSHNSDIERAIPVRNTKKKSVHQNVTITDMPELSGVYVAKMISIEPLLEKMSRIYSKKELYFKSEMKSNFLLILTRVFRHIINEKSGTGISEIIDYINSHCSEPLTNKMIGEIFHYHPNYINKLFVTHTGHSLHNYLLNRRIEMAEILLNSTNFSIKEIAEKTGWKNVAQFSKAFKGITGFSPGKFRVV